MYVYYATMAKPSSAARSWDVKIPDFDVAFAAKGSELKAVEEAAAKLKDAIESALILGKKLPKASEVKAPKGGKAVAIAVDAAEPGDRFCTVAQAMAALGVTQPRISHLVRDKKLRAVKKGHRTMIDRESLAEFATVPRRPGRPAAAKTTKAAAKPAAKKTTKAAKPAAKKAAPAKKPAAAKKTTKPAAKKTTKAAAKPAAKKTTKAAKPAAKKTTKRTKASK